MLFRRSPPTLKAPRLQPGDVVQVAGCDVRLAVNARARHIGLRLDPSRREVVLTAPSARRLAEALAFAQSRADWIAARLADLPPVLAFVPGALIEVAGASCRLERRGNGLLLRIGPKGSHYPLRHWDGQVFVFTAAGENAPEGSVSAVTFTIGGKGRPSALAIEFYADSGRSTFVRR